MRMQLLEGEVQSTARRLTCLGPWACDYIQQALVNAFHTFDMMSTSKCRATHNTEVVHKECQDAAGRHIHRVAEAPTLTAFSLIDCPALASRMAVHVPACSSLIKTVKFLKSRQLSLSTQEVEFLKSRQLSFSGWVRQQTSVHLAQAKTEQL